jgi:hypothetical protein
MIIFMLLTLGCVEHVESSILMRLDIVLSRSISQAAEVTLEA